MEKPAFPLPAFVLDEAKLLQNLKLFKNVSQKAGIEVLLALKAFSVWPVFPQIAEYLHGFTASSFNEARLIFEATGLQSHGYFPALKKDECAELDKYCSTVIFNSLQQFEQLHDQFDTETSFGLRVNPEISLVETDLYNPGRKGSRLGIAPDNLPKKLHEAISGLHMHVLCESSEDDFCALLDTVEKTFKPWLNQIKWINFGGGHLLTKEGYDIERFIDRILQFKERYDLKIIIEPGSAILWETGDLYATIIDIVDNRGTKTIMLDVSFTAHMPDTLEMPYRPEVLLFNEGSKSEKHSYNLGGNSCLSGDYLSDYSFSREVKPGDTLILKDMLHYTTVKTTFFNGIQHPDILYKRLDGRIIALKKYTYQDYKQHLARE